MIGLCFEGETTCSSCGKPLPMNALVETIVCSECLCENKFSPKDWKKLISDMFTAGPTYSENEGTPSTVMGARNYKILYGRQNPKFLDTKTYMNEEDIEIFGAEGKIINPKTQIAYSIRPVPENFKEVCPHVSYLIGEDFTLFSKYDGDSAVFNSKPQGDLIPFTCPSCAGSLQIDGSERTLKCQFCGNESFIPDLTWQKIHPVKTKHRFYFWFDEKSVKFDWDSDLHDLVAGDDGTLYLSVDPIFGSDDELWIIALNPDLTTKWKRNNLKFKTATSGGEAKLGISPNKELILWSGDRSSILLLSTEDGSEIKRIGKKLEESERTEFPIMDFTQCRYLAVDIDGNYFALVDRDKKNSDNRSYYEFLVINQEGKLQKPWGLGDVENKGFFGAIKNLFSGVEPIPYFEDIYNKVTRIKDYDIKINVGKDGSYFFHSYKLFARYNHEGKFIYMNEIKDGHIPHKINGDKEGNAFYLFESNTQSKTTLVKVSPDGKNTSVVIKNVIDGGSLCKEDMLAISSNGIYYCAGYNGRLRIFDANFNVLYVSKCSLKDEEESIAEIKERED